MRPLPKIFQDYPRLVATGVRACRWSELPVRLQKKITPWGQPSITVLIPNHAPEIIFNTLPNTNQRLAFVIAAGATATIIEHGAGERLVLANQSSRVSYLIDAADGLPTRFNYIAKLATNSWFSWYFWAKNQRDSQGSIRIDQTKKNFGRIVGGLLSDGLGHLKLELVNNHRQQHSAGNIDFKAVSQGPNHIIINGLIAIGPSAAFTDSYLTQDGLLLSPESELQMMPNLEILNSEVKASHRATVGPLDSQASHYLAARGLTPARARQLLVKGFFARLLPQIENPIIKTQFTHLIS